MTTALAFNRQSSRGSSQDPLNYLARRISKNRRYSKALKRHLALMVRRAKATGPHSDEQAVALASRISSYGRRQYLEETLDALEPTEKGYKDLIMALCKMSEDAKRNLAASKLVQRTQVQRRAVPTARTAQHESSSHEPEEPDGETA